MFERGEIGSTQARKGMFRGCERGPFRVNWKERRKENLYNTLVSRAGTKITAFRKAHIKGQKERKRRLFRKDTSKADDEATKTGWF